MYQILSHADEVVNEGFMDHMTNNSHWYGDGGFVVFWFVLLAVIALVVWILAGKFIGTSSQSSNKNTKDSLEIAKSRYAKGELTKKEFKELKKELS